MELTNIGTRVRAEVIARLDALIPVHSLDVSGVRRRLGANMRKLRNWQKVEGADTNPTLTTIVRVAFGLDVDISVLFAPARPR